jgi:hypothetical protein
MRKRLRKMGNLGLFLIGAEKNQRLKIKKKNTEQKSKTETQ